MQPERSLGSKFRVTRRSVALPPPQPFFLTLVSLNLAEFWSHFGPNRWGRFGPTCSPGSPVLSGGGNTENTRPFPWPQLVGFFAAMAAGQCEGWFGTVTTTCSCALQRQEDVTCTYGCRCDNPCSSAAKVVQIFRAYLPSRLIIDYGRRLFTWARMALGDVFHLT